MGEAILIQQVSAADTSALHYERGTVTNAATPTASVDTGGADAVIGIAIGAGSSAGSTNTTILDMPATTCAAFDNAPITNTSHIYYYNLTDGVAAITSARFNYNGNPSSTYGGWRLRDFIVIW